MPHSYADTFEQPAVEKIDGKDITIAPLTQRDYLPWIEELTRQRKENARTAQPPGSKVMELARWKDYVENLEVTPADLQTYVFRASGTIKVLELAGAKALKKAGQSEQVEKIVGEWIDSRSAKENEMLAIKVSGLFRRQEIEQMYPAIPVERKEAESPNGDSQSDADQTGRSGAPSLRPAHEPTFST